MMRSGLQQLAVWMLALLVASASLAQTATTKVFSNEQLDQMLAPIALYPDSLLAQVLMASTYPVAGEVRRGVVEGQSEAAG